MQQQVKHVASLCAATMGGSGPIMRRAAGGRIATGRRRQAACAAHLVYRTLQRLVLDAGMFEVVCRAAQSVGMAASPCRAEGVGAGHMVEFLDTQRAHHEVRTATSAL